MNHDIIPQGDYPFDNFQSNLIKQVTDNAVAWHIPQEEIDELLPLQQAWKDRWQVANQLKKRTQTDVADKNLARNKFKKALRPFLQARVRHNRYMSETEKSVCGIKPRDIIPTRIKAPEMTVDLQLSINKGRELLASFRLGDGDGISRYGKPKGVARCEMVYTIGRQPANADDWDFIISASRSPHHFRDLHEKYAGQTIVFYARWVNPRNEPGFWSGPFYSNIP